MVNCGLQAVHRTVDLEPRVVGLGWVRKISTMKSNVGG